MDHAQRAGRITWSAWPAVFYLAVVLLFVLGAVWQAWPMPETAFRSDRSTISWLSSAQLWATLALALRLAADGVLSRRLGAWLVAAMAWLAFDEQFMLHEMWKFRCVDWTALCEYQWITELPMLLVGALGAATGVWMHRALPDVRARRMLWAGIVCGIVALVVDQAGAPLALALYEEGLEVLAEALLLGLLLGLRPIGKFQ